jgi:hypothetical protein
VEIDDLNSQRAMPATHFAHRYPAKSFGLAMAFCALGLSDKMLTLTDDYARQRNNSLEFHAFFTTLLSIIICQYGTYSWTQFGR